MEAIPKWIPFFFGGGMILMAALILGALFGVVPTGGGQFLAPPEIILGLGLCLLCGGVAIMVPQGGAAILRGSLMLIALVSLALVCNWTAFAPAVTYSSTTNFGVHTVTREDPMGGRIVFGLAAIGVDLFLLSVIVGWLRSRFR